MNFPKFFKNKKFYLASSAIILAGLFFMLTASPARACEKNESIFSYFNPTISFINKTIKGLGFDVVLAATPDPDNCGNDSVSCAGTPPVPTATIYWSAAPPTIVPEAPLTFDHYTLTVWNANIYGGVGWAKDYNIATNSYTISSELENSKQYWWRVEAYYNSSDEQFASASRGYGNRPNGSFTTVSTCIVAAPDVYIFANHTANLLIIPSTNTGVEIEWDSSRATSCSVTSSPSSLTWTGEPGGVQLTGNLPVGDRIYTASCIGLGGPAEKSVTVRVSPPGCTNQCTQNFCSGNTVQLCSPDANGCMAITPSINCSTLGSNYSCSNGQCVCTIINPSCTAANTCSGQTCNNGCSDISGTKDCSATGGGAPKKNWREMAP